MEKTNAKQQKFDAEVLEFIRMYTNINYNCTDKDIANKFNVSTDVARKSVERLRKTESIINLQDKRGYRLENGDDEDGQALIRRWIAQETSRAIACFAHLKGAKSKLKNPNQMMIDLHKAVDDAFNEYNPVVERYFEAMKNHCDNNSCYGYQNGKCPFYDVCDIAFGKGFINFTDLTPAQITALEPYAIAWAESEGIK